MRIDEITNETLTWLRLKEMGYNFEQEYNTLKNLLEVVKKEGNTLPPSFYRPHVELFLQKITPFVQEQFGTTDVDIIRIQNECGQMIQEIELLSSSLE